jgi:hypothetical protein
MEALGWALIGALMIAWLALAHARRVSVSGEQGPRTPQPASPGLVARRPRPLWLNYKRSSE